MARKPSSSDAAKIQGPVDYQLKVTLAGIQPPIWRRVLVPGEFTLEKLHQVLQEVMPWTDTHLHMFIINGVNYSDPRQRDEWNTDELDEADHTLSQLVPRAGAKFRYEYDFGDDWDHHIIVEKITPAPADSPRVPLCLTGKNSAPPEDSGGSMGYMSKLEVLEEKPSGEDAEEIMEWMGEDFDPTAFSVDDVNDRLKEIFKKQTPSRRKGKSRAPKEGAPRIWAGTTLDASRAVQSSTVPSGRTAVLAVWFDITNPDNVTLASVSPGFADESAPPLIHALFSPLPQTKGRPSQIHGASREDIEILKSQQFEGINVSPDPIPDITAWAEEIVDDLRDIAERGDTEPDLGQLLPVPGRAPEIDEAFALSWFEAALFYWKAKPWIRLTDAHLFEMTFPDGEVLVASPIGLIGAAYGLVLFSNAEDYQIMVDIYKNFFESLTSGVEEDHGPDAAAAARKLPLLLGLNFDQGSEFPDEFHDQVDTCAPAWKRQRYRPYGIKSEGDQSLSPTPADFLHMALAASTLARLADQHKTSKKWPPKPGFEARVAVPWQGREETVSVKYIGL